MSSGWFTDFKDWENIYSEKGDYHFYLSGFNQWWFHRNYKMLTYLIKKNDKVLDLGCGDGLLGDYCVSNELYGNDISQEALNLAKRNKKYRDLYKQDISKFEVSPNTFDQVISSLTLQYLDRNSFISCVKQVGIELKTKGKFIFSYPNIKENNNEIMRILSAEGFEILSVKGICFRLPKIIYSMSYSKVFKPLAFLYYTVSKLAYLFPFRSYHYVIYAEKK